MIRMTQGIGLALACLAGCAGGPRGPEHPRMYENMDATQRIDILPDGHGTAVVLTEDGDLLTNAHVAGKGDRMLLVNISEDGKPPVAYPASVVSVDERHDLAVVRIRRRFRRTVVIGSMEEVHPGDQVYDVGYPYALGRMSGVGNVKAVGWDFSEPDRPDLKVEGGLALDISNGPGSSGSGIYLARNGKLVGLMQRIMTFGPDDGGRITVRVAIPVDVIRAFLDRAHVPYRTGPAADQARSDGTPRPVKGRFFLPKEKTPRAIRPWR